MKNLLPVIICLFIAISSLNAQAPAKLWQFDNADAFNFDPASNVIFDGNNTFVCAMSIDTLSTTYFFKLDANGAVISQDTIGNFYYPVEYNKRMVRDIHGAIYICGNVVDSNFHSEIQVIKYDSALNRMWSFTYLDNDPDFYSSNGLLYSSFDDKMYLVGNKNDSVSHTIALKFDTGGTILWNAVDTFSYGLQLIAFNIDHTGHLILGGSAVPANSSNGDDLVLMKYDTSGTLAWTSITNGTMDDDDYLSDFCIDLFDNIYATGDFIDSVTGKILKVDSSGTLLWLKNMSNSGLSKVISDAAGNVYVAGFDSVPEDDFIMYKYDSAGTLLHSNVCDIPFHNRYNIYGFNSIYINDSAQVYYLNSTDTAGAMKWLMAKSDSTLQLIWSFTFPDSLAVFGGASALCFTNDGFVVTGNLEPNLSVVRWVEPQTPLAINALSTKNISYWPNPVKDVLNFNNDGSISGLVNLKVYDVTSRLVFETTKDVDALNALSFPLTKINAGVYFFTLENKGELYSGKIYKN